MLAMASRHPILSLNTCSAVFSDFATPLQDLSCGPGADPEFLVSDMGKILKIFSGSELCILV